VKWNITTSDISQEIYALKQRMDIYHQKLEMFKTKVQANDVAGASLLIGYINENE
jgi:hypothetical protein